MKNHYRFDFFDGFFFKMKQSIADECSSAGVFVFRSEIVKTSSPLVYLLGEHKVFKMFMSKKEYTREIDGLQRVEPCKCFECPKLVAKGKILIKRSKLRYIITSRVPGMCYQDFVIQGKSMVVEDMIALARGLGLAMRELHDTKSPQDNDSPSVLWSKWNKTLLKRRHKLGKRKYFRTRMSEKAYEEMLGDEFWPSNLLCFVKWGDVPVFMHGDLNNENTMIVKNKESGRYGFGGIVDFGDSCFGHRLYDFVAVHLSVFFADKDLLLVFLQAYGFDMLPEDSSAFAFQCLAYMLLSDSPAIKTAVKCCPQIQECTSLKEMGEILFDTSSRTGVWGVHESLKKAEEQMNKTV